MLQVCEEYALNYKIIFNATKMSVLILKLFRYRSQ